MPIKVTLDDGTETEALTQEEANALAETRASEIAAEKQIELDALVAEKAETEEKLKKFEDKDYNFAQLRQKAEQKGQVDEDVKQRLEDISKRLDEVASKPILETKEEFVRNQIGNDKDKRDRFDYYFKKLGGDAKSKEEVLKASQEALALASNGDYKPDLNSNMYGTGVGNNYRGNVQPAKGESFDEIASLLGNTPDDIKKYGEKK